MRQTLNTSSTTSSSSSSFHSNKSKPETTKRARSTTKLSTDPQSVAARERRHRISERFKILQSMVPGGAKMDTVSMLDEAIRYVKFLKAQIWFHQNMFLFLNDHEVMSSCAYTPAAEQFEPRLFGYDASTINGMDSQDMSLTVMDSEYPPLFGSVDYE